MNRCMTKLVVIFMISAVAPAALAEITIIHAGELLAIPGMSAKPQQTIVIEELLDAGFVMKGDKIYKH